MGAIIMSVLVSVIAIVGGVYFYIQDKKETKIQFENIPPIWWNILQSQDKVRERFLNLP